MEWKDFAVSFLPLLAGVPISGTAVLATLIGIGILLLAVMLLFWFVFQKAILIGWALAPLIAGFSLLWMSKDRELRGVGDVAVYRIVPVVLVFAFLMISFQPTAQALASFAPFSEVSFGEGVTVGQASNAGLYSWNDLGLVTGLDRLPPVVVQIVTFVGLLTLGVALYSKFK